MAELASGAVSSLLGVIRNEARLLEGVKGDVQFIKEEMESMNSFLLHLARTAPAGGEHNEQVRTWMGQVRLLAQDCNNCIDLYLYRGNPDIHLAKGGLRRYLWWLPWFLRKMMAQHDAAVQLRVLKDRARDVGERRLRYGVEVPAKQSPDAPGGAPPAGAGDDEDEDDDGDKRGAPTAGHHSGGRGDFFELRTLDDYFHSKLVEWMKQVEDGKTGAAATSVPSIAIVTPDDMNARTLAREALAVAKTRNSFNCPVLVDIPALHFVYRQLRPMDILYYILREFQQRAKLGAGDGGEEPQEDLHWRTVYRRKRGIIWNKREVIEEIQRQVYQMKVDDKMETIEKEILQVKDVQLDMEQMKDVQLDQQDLGALLLLLKSAAAAAAEQGSNRTTSTSQLYHEIIQKTAKKFKDRIEEEAGTSPVHLDVAEYENILREVFPMTSKPQEQDTKTTTTRSTTTTLLGDDRIKEIIDKVKLEILREVLPGTSNSKPLQEATRTTAAAIGEDPIKDTKMVHEAKPETQQEPQLETKSDSKKQVTSEPTKDQEETIKKMKEIRSKIIEQLMFKGILDKIKKEHLTKSSKTLIILKIDQEYEFGLEDTRKALSLLHYIARGAVIMTASKDIQWANKYSNPPREPLDCSLVGLYHDTVLELTSQQKHEDSNYDPQIFRDILDKCEAHEFSMRIFVHALYANPKRSSEDLHKLHDAMKVAPKTSGRNTAKKTGSIAKKMIKFSYNDLPKEYKSCFFYLAIFPPGHMIRRSTLIGRWVAEGLITTEDWRWSSSARQAERCFGALIDRWLVYPAQIGATGKVKSCIVGDVVHEVITKIAKKQRIVETRLSHHLARHFSIFNSLHLRASDTITTFFQKMYESSQLSQLKVLDLEGCRCFGNKQYYLKNICSEILLLKYLNLRGTDITQLPIEINNLRELEVLDIRQTKVPAFATRNVMLLKLKRLLAGHTSSSQSMAIGAEEFSSVWIPEKIEKMVNMEVLSNVRAPTSQDLIDIRKLWQLRKLGVVIEDKHSHLWNLFRTISDLNECLVSLSVTLPTTGFQGTPTTELPERMRSRLKYSPKLLESLSISGTTEQGALLPLLAKDCNQLNKVTLARTTLDQKNLKVLAELPNLRCVRLQHIACTEKRITFRKGEFQSLEYFLVEGSNLTEITFDNGAAPKLEKFVLSLTGYLKSLSGVDRLPKLEELVLRNNSRLLSFFDNARQIVKVILRGTSLKQGDMHILAKNPNMRCLVLLDKSYVESQLSFNKNEFPKLNLLVVMCSNITKISFTSAGSTPKLEKILWSFTKMESLSGIDNLPRLKELEFNGDSVPDVVQEAIKKHKNRPESKHNKPENQDRATGVAPEEDDDVARFPFCWKNKV